MSESTALSLGQLHHLGIVVKDIEKTVVFYTKALGVGPFQIQERSASMLDARGNPNPCTMKFAFASLGPVNIELVQVTKGENMQTEFLEKKGEGVQHLGYRVPDLEAELPKLDALGLKVIASARRDNDLIAVFLEGEWTHGVAIELVQAPK